MIVPISLTIGSTDRWLLHSFAGVARLLDHIDPTLEYLFKRINPKYPALRADVAKLALLHAHGGIVHDESTAPSDLKGFQKVELAPGESTSVAFSLSVDDLAFYTATGKWEAEPGDFKVWVGPDSQEGLEGEFALVE